MTYDTLSQKELKNLAEETGTTLEDVLSALRWWISQGEANDESFKHFYRVQIEVARAF